MGKHEQVRFQFLVETIFGNHHTILEFFQLILPINIKEEKIIIETTETYQFH